MRLFYIFLIVFIILAAFMPLSKELEDDHDYSDLGEDDD